MAPDPSEVYLDNAASTRVAPAVLEAMQVAFEQTYGNPSSVHRQGVAAERLVKEARERVARALSAQPGEIVFTSGGTEADALAVLGAARRQSKRRHVVLSAFEHPAVLRSAELLSAEGFEVTPVPPAPDGVVDPQRFLDAVRPETVLVSLMLVQNELGTIQPVGEVARAVRARAPGALVHTDAVQGLGKLRLAVDELGVDLLSVAAHKVHGPKGVGALYVRKNVRLQPLWGGGGHEGGLRPGTLNVPGIVGLGLAAELCDTERLTLMPRLGALRDRLVEGVLSALPSTVQLGSPEHRVATHASLGFPGLRAEVLLHAVESRGVLVSAGSACASGQKGSHVLSSIGVGENLGVLRVTLGRETTALHVERAIGAIVESVQQLSPARARAV
jgi:cysteine desulfurase